MSLQLIQSKFLLFFEELSNIYRSKLYINNYFDFIDIIEKKDNGTYIRSIDRISMENVSYKYGKNKVFDRLNFEFKKDRLNLILGENGSGKSTLIKILSSLYNDYEGRVLVNDLELKELCFEQYRKKICVIFQDFYHFESTIREIVTMQVDNFDIEDSKIIECLRKVGLDEKYICFDQGLDTSIGKYFGGEELSKGQRQKLVLSKVFLKKYDVLLLDEPTSYLDEDSKKIIINNIIETYRNKIVIVVSHDPSLFVDYNPNILYLGD